MAARKNKLVKQWVSSVLILFLLAGAISLAFNDISSNNGNGGNAGNSNDNLDVPTDTIPPEEEVLPDGIRLNKTELIF